MRLLYEKKVIIFTSHTIDSSFIVYSIIYNFTMASIGSYKIAKENVINLKER